MLTFPRRSNNGGVPDPEEGSLIRLETQSTSWRRPPRMKNGSKLHHGEPSPIRRHRTHETRAPKEVRTVFMNAHHATASPHDEGCHHEHTAEPQHDHDAAPIRDPVCGMTVAPDAGKPNGSARRPHLSFLLEQMSRQVHGRSGPLPLRRTQGHQTCAERHAIHLSDAPRDRARRTR